MELQDVIRIRRKELGLSLEQIAQSCGVGKSIVAKWERGDVKNIRRDNLASLSDVLMVSPLVLLEREEFIPQKSQNLISLENANVKRIPRIGRIACGVPILAEENIEEYDCVPVKWKADFTLLCIGNSMAPKILDGDLVAIRKQSVVDNGQIAAVVIDNKATLKRVHVHPDQLVLLPENPECKPIILSKEEMNAAHIAGRVVGICRDM